MSNSVLQGMDMTQNTLMAALSLLAGLAAAIGGAGEARAALIVTPSPSITITATGGDAAHAAADAFEAGLDRFTTQSFENLAQGDHGQLVTDIGTFTAVTPGRLGPTFSIAQGNVSGRALDGQFLDSHDLVALAWDVDRGGQRFNSIGFFIQDPADQGAAFQLTFADGSAQFAFLDFTQLRNGDLYYVTVFFNAPLLSARVDFINVNGARGDGWGIDDLTVGLAVPEPGMLGMFGVAALTGLGLWRRR
jgi:hypothetical protein